MTVKIQIRRDTAANWTSYNPILADGEQGYETDTRKTKVGNGSDDWNTLAYIEAGINNSNDNFTVNGEWYFNNIVEVDASGQTSGFLAVGDTFFNTPKLQRNFAVGQEFDAAAILKGYSEDTLENFAGISVQLRIETSDLPDTFLGGFNAYRGNYVDTDNFISQFSISTLNRVAGVNNFQSVATFDIPNGFVSKLPFTAEQEVVAEQGIETNGLNSYGNAYSNIANLFRTDQSGGTSRSAVKATTQYTDDVSLGKGVSWNSLISTNDIGTFDIGEISYVIGDFDDADNFTGTINLITYNRSGGSSSSQTVLSVSGNELTVIGETVTNGLNSTGSNILNGPLFLRGLNTTVPTSTADAGDDGEIRFGVDGGNFYMYAYVNGLGWIRSQFATF
jgi:hypothetical protein